MFCRITDCYVKYILYYDIQLDLHRHTALSSSCYMTGVVHRSGDAGLLYLYYFLFIQFDLCYFNFYQYFMIHYVVISIWIVILLLVFLILRDEVIATKIMRSSSRISSQLKRPQIPLRPHHFWTYTSNLTTVVKSILKYMINGTTSILKS